MDTKQPNALRLAALLNADVWPGSMTLVSYARECAAELRRLHAENEALSNKLQTFEALGGAVDDLQLLRMGYASARLEIASLKVRAADARHDIDDLTERDEIQRLRIAELEAQLAAIGAGGVEPLRKRECLHQICETAAPASDGAYPKLHERAAFEDWIKKDGGDLRMFGSGQNSHYCNSAVNNAWGGWKASAARVAAKASAPMVLSEPVATLHCNDECYVWARASDAGKRMRFEQALALYTEQQVRAMLATVGQALEASPIDADAQRDAERYRWLRNEETGWYVGPSYSTYNDNVCDGEYHNFFGVELDKAIDAAHAAQGGV